MVRETDSDGPSPTRAVFSLRVSSEPFAEGPSIAGLTCFICPGQNCVLFLLHRHNRPYWRSDSINRRQNRLVPASGIRGDCQI